MFRTPKDRISIRILQTMLSGIPLLLAECKGSRHGSLTSGAELWLQAWTFLCKVWSSARPQINMAAHKGLYIEDSSLIEGPSPLPCSMLI